MSTNGETADLMVREGIQITESALKLAGLGAKKSCRPSDRPCQ